MFCFAVCLYSFGIGLSCGYAGCLIVLLYDVALIVCFRGGVLALLLCLLLLLVVVLVVLVVWFLLDLIVVRDVVCLFGLECGCCLFDCEYFCCSVLKLLVG